MKELEKPVYIEFMAELVNILKYGNDEVVQEISDLVFNQVVYRQNKVRQEAEKDKIK